MDLLYLEANDSVSCVCLLFYTLIVAVISFWIGTSFRSRSSLPNCTCLGTNTLFQLRSYLTFVSMSEFIRRKIKRKELKLRVEDGLIPSTVGENNLNSNNTRIELQTNVLIEAILSCYIHPWYGKISEEPTFPDQLKRGLQFGMNRLQQKIQNVDRSVLAKEAMQICHAHWKEYCSALEKQSSTTTSESLVKIFRFTHECVINPEELSKQYESLACLLLKDVLIQDLNCNIFRQFLSTILVKCFLMYYTNILCEPKWINKALIALISTGSILDTPYDSESISNTQPSTPSFLNDFVHDPEIHSDANSSATKPSTLSSNESKKGSTSSEGSTNSDILMSSSLENPFRKSEVTCNTTTSRETFTNYFEIESPGFKKTGRKTTVTAALGEVLSSAAFPLLPEGYSYCEPVQEIESSTDLMRLEKSISPVEEDLLSTSISPQKETKFSYVDNEVLPVDEVHGPPATTPSESPSTISSKIRHYSLNENKSRDSANIVCMDKSTVSLDETKEHQTIVRQSEFDDKSGEIDTMSEEERETTRLNKESEDFAATIAKLRSLLEQRESQSNLMEGKSNDDGEKEETKTDSGQLELSDNHVTKIPVYKMKSSPQMTTSDMASDVSSDNWGRSLETDKLNRIVCELEESEADVSCFFLNVLITKAEACGDMGSQSTLYCIQYEGVYLDQEKEGESQKFVLRTTIVKRRFTDFLALQTQLEGNPIWKPHLKGMKTPKKWLQLSFTNQNAVSQRRAHLEHYLQQLCYHPVLGFCKELRQFMAYGEDGYQAFGTPHSDPTTSHKFEKLTKTFTEVFNTLKDAVPHFESEFPASATDSMSKSPTHTKRKRMIPSFLNFEKYSNDRLKVTDVDTLNSSNEDNNKLIKLEVSDSEHKDEEQIPDVAGNPSNKLEMEKSPMQVSPNTFSEADVSPECEEDIIDQVDSTYPLASAATKLLCDVLWLPQHKPHSASVSAFMAISGKSLENYLLESMDIFLCEEAFSGYLDMLTSALNEWSQQTNDTINQTDSEHEFTKLDLKNSFKTKIPVWIRWMWGRNRSEETIDRLAEFFQCSEINHDLVLSVVELIFLKLMD